MTPIPVPVPVRQRILALAAAAAEVGTTSDVLDRVRPTRPPAREPQPDDALKSACARNDRAIDEFGSAVKAYGAATDRVWAGHRLSTPLAIATFACLVAAVGASAQVQARARRRRRRGQCVRCGYDLRGSSGDLCSECGTPTARSRTSTLGRTTPL